GAGLPLFAGPLHPLRDGRIGPTELLDHVVASGQRDADHLADSLAARTVGNAVGDALRSLTVLLRVVVELGTEAPLRRLRVRVERLVGHVPQVAPVTAVGRDYTGISG